MDGDERPEWQQRAREVLEGLSNLRIHPHRLEILRSAVHRGGTSTVAFGSLVSEPKGELGQPEVVTDVAVKNFCFAMSNDRKKDYNGFAHEAKTLCDLSHPNVVKLVGFFEDEENETASLVFPWEANGNIREFIASGKWEIPERISLMKDVISGISYLHSQEPPILHGDLKSLNILVNSSNHAFITDFGSARRIRRDPASEASVPSLEELMRGAASPGDNLEQPRIEYSAATETLTLSTPGYTVRWAAPEVLFDWFDLPGDIWAFGWVCWEV
ncbi:hypothetical protein FRC04_002929 [Tulasnella sp. 424]|nr:hypothetical protein FRC04_002929 [Tulasnella sp. 424]